MPTRRGKGEGSILRRKDGRWAGFITLGYNENGQQVKRWVYGHTRREVADKLRTWHVKVGSGYVTNSKLSVGEWLAEFAERRAAERNLSSTTKRNYRHYQKHLLPLARVALRSLTAAQVQAWLGSDTMANLSGSSRAHAFQFLNAALKDAVLHELITVNVCDRVARPSVRLSRPRVVWTKAEVQSFLAVAQTHRLYALFYLLLASGMRIGEALALQWPDLAPPKLAITATLSQKRTLGPTKTAASTATLHLDQNTIDVLEAHRSRMREEGQPDNGFIFCSDVGTALFYRNVRRVWVDLIALAKVRKMGLHGTRHTWTTLAYQAGLNPGQVAARLRHADPALSLRVYQQISESDHVAAALSLDTLLHLQTKKSGEFEANATQLDANNMLSPSEEQ